MSHPNSEPDPHSRRGWLWPWVVGGFLALTVVKYIVVLSTIASDPSIAIQEDYYRRALAWDDERAARAVSDALGWQVLAAIGPAEATSSADQIVPSRLEMRGRVSLTVHDREGEPLAGAAMALRIFHRARAAFPADEVGTTDATGAITFEVPRGRRGLWEIEIEVTHAGEQFSLKRTLIWGAAP